MATAVIKDEKAIQDLAAALQIQPIELEVDYMNIFVYGDPGTGKTFLTGTAEDHEETSPLLLFDIEGGATTLRGRKGLQRKRIKSLVELSTAYDQLHSAIKQDDEGKPYIPGVKTIGIDSLSELADLAMRVVMHAAYQRNPDKVDVDVPSPREWGIVRNQIRKIVRGFRDLPCHVIYTAHANEVVSEGQPTKYTPGFAGKLKMDVPGFMDIVGYMTTTVEPGTGVIIRKLQTQGTNRVVAKDRTQALPAILENPSLPLMYDYIIGNHAAE